MWIETSDEFAMKIEEENYRPCDLRRGTAASQARV